MTDTWGPAPDVTAAEITETAATYGWLPSYRWLSTVPVPEPPGDDEVGSGL